MGNEQPGSTIDLLLAPSVASGLVILYTEVAPNAVSDLNLSRDILLGLWHRRLTFIVKLRGDSLGAGGGLTMSIKVKRAASSSSMQNMNICAVFSGNQSSGVRTTSPSWMSTRAVVGALRGGTNRRLREILPSLKHFAAMGLSGKQPHRIVKVRMDVGRPIVQLFMGAHDKVNARDRRWL
ncbi:predicted protein [Postia placenta Mad-698-R]|nr:predicted protein [Postia placenta Mad-698-R]